MWGFTVGYFFNKTFFDSSNCPKWPSAWFRREVSSCFVLKEIVSGAMVFRDETAILRLQRKKEVKIAIRFSHEDT